MGDKVLIVTRPDKKQILFYNDRSSSIDIDEGKIVHYMYVSTDILMLKLFCYHNMDLLVNENFVFIEHMHIVIFIV